MKHFSVIKYTLPIVAIVLVGCSSRNSASVATSASSADMSGSTSIDKQAEKGRLGTQWGESVSSAVTNVNTQRMTAQPSAIASIFYSEKTPKDYWQRADMVSLKKVNLDIEKENGGRFKMAYTAPNTYQLKAKEGQRYKLYFYNSDEKQSYEIVATVDGIDVLSGQKGSVKNAGYIIYPNQSLTIEGFRKSSSDVAAFRFSKPQDSYAAHSAAGDVNNVGVIGVAIYPTTQKPMKDCRQQAFPQDNGYAPEPCNKN